jgi:hypothetical protein
VERDVFENPVFTPSDQSPMASFSGHALIIQLHDLSGKRLPLFRIMPLLFGCMICPENRLPLFRIMPLLFGRMICPENRLPLFRIMPLLFGCMICPESRLPLFRIMLQGAQSTADEGHDLAQGSIDVV